METVKVWQDVFSEWPFAKPIVDYWIWAAPDTQITSKEAYTPLDLMADLGGLTFFLFILGRFLLSTCA